jgi:signal transduction histidine kinase
MTRDAQSVVIESIPLREMAEALRQTQLFAETEISKVSGVDQVDRVVAKAGAVLAEPGLALRFYWLVLDGEIRAERPEQDGSRTTAGIARAGEGFGEAPFLIGKTRSTFFILAAQPSTLLRFTEEQFWALLACCPAVRKVVLANMAQRLQAYQVEALHREKLVSLGTLAAGLMHELHNPGTAAKHAASQLRQNLLLLQQMSLHLGELPKTPAQVECLRSLLDLALRGCHAPAMSTIEQADAEEAMAKWITAAGVENAFKLAPVLVGIGLEHQQLACAQQAFTGGDFSRVLNWLEALVSGVAMVGAIEESVGRISDLVMAVKKFAYDERSPARELDVHDSLQSTLTILGYKLRIKNLSVEKCFAAMPSTIRARGFALSQVWTNLIDNAVDASPENAQIDISTWTEPDWLAVGITDHGAGIPPETLPHIFEAFFTTKPLGLGTGMGLEIVHRIVTQKFGGNIQVESKPGSTRFIVRLPLDSPAESEDSAPPAN